MMCISHPMSWIIAFNYKRTIFFHAHQFIIFHLISRLGCLVVLVAAVIEDFLFVLDLTQFGDVEKNPGPGL